MKNTEAIRNLEEPFKKYFSLLGISLKPGDERLNSLNCRGKVKVHKFTRISPWLYRKLGRIYGKSFTLKISLGGAKKYEQQGEVNISKLREFCKNLETGVIVGVLNVDFSMDKRCLARQVLGNPANINATVIFQEEVLIGITSESIKDLDYRSKELESEDSFEGSFCEDDSSKQVILVPHMDVLVTGDRLAIVGGNGVEQIKKVLVTRTSDASNKISFEEEVQQIRSYSESNIKWTRFGPLRLTPLHFDFKVNQELTDFSQARELLDRLAWFQFNLSLMYMSDSNCYNGDRIEITINGVSGSSQINLPTRFPQEHVARKFFQCGAPIWLKACILIYDNERQVFDRLATVQNVVAQTFPGSHDDSYLKQMLEEAQTFHDSLKTHWKAFSEGKVEKYFDKVKQISEFVTTATHSYSERIDSLIKSLTSTMLGAVVTVVGAFLGSLLKEKFNPLMLIIGLAVYAGYLAIFPGFIGLTNTWQHFSELNKRMESQFEVLKNYILGLEKEKWESWGEQLKCSESRFKLWFIVTFVSYLVVFVLSVAAVFFLLLANK